MNKYVWMTVTFIIMIVTNALANILPINGQRTGEISDSLNVLFTPAGYVFSIWGLIYALVLIWLVMQWIRKDMTKTQAVLFSASSIFNTLWLLTYHYEFFWTSTAVMVLLLLTLIALYLTYPKGNWHVAERLPFSVYLGWIAVATIANFSFTMKNDGISLGISEVYGTILLMVVATFIALGARFISRDIFFPLVVVWAFTGIIVSNSSQAIIVATTILIIIIVATIIIGFLKRRNVRGVL